MFKLGTLPQSVEIDGHKITIWRQEQAAVNAVRFYASAEPIVLPDSEFVVVNPPPWKEPLLELAKIVREQLP